MEKPIRILQAFVANDKGGLTGYICQNYRFIDKKKIQFDFLTFETKPLDFEQEFISYGARFFHIPRPSHLWGYTFSLKKILAQNSYSAIHFNMSYANFIPILIANMLGKKRIIVHSHSTDIDDKRLYVRGIKLGIHKIGRQLFRYIATDYFACSKLAAEWMYPDSIMQSSKYHFAKNAINASKYLYNSQIREKVRNNLHLSKNTFVIGHIGRFTYQKNHEFLIDVFYKLLGKEKNALLLLIGDGPEKTKIKKKVEQLGIINNVLFLGQRNDVPQILQAMDCFVLPSRFEGLGIVGVEAQAAGLSCILSAEIPEEIDISGNVQFLPLDCPLNQWSEAILSTRGQKRITTDIMLKKSGYSIRDSIKEIEKIYLKV